MDFEKIKRFYIETWWLWAIYFVLGVLACWKISWVFLSAFPIVGLISLYFAAIRGPKNWNDDSENDASEDDAHHPKDNQ